MAPDNEVRISGDLLRSAPGCAGKLRLSSACSILTNSLFPLSDSLDLRQVMGVVDSDELNQLERM
jgi:hypothetical protein